MAKRFADVLRRRYKAIGNDQKPSQQQLSVNELQFINGIPGVPHCDCSVNAAARTVEMIGSDAEATPVTKTAKDDREESRLAQLFARLLIRGMRPSDTQLSSTDKAYLRNTLVNRWGCWGGSVGADAASAAATSGYEMALKVLEWQASQDSEHLPSRYSDDEEEKKLARSFQDVRRRRFGAIGEKPSQQQLSADEVHFINGICRASPFGCSVNAVARAAARAVLLTIASGGAGADATPTESSPIPAADRAFPTAKRSRTECQLTESDDEGTNASETMEYQETGIFSPPICKQGRHWWSKKLCRMSDELGQISVAAKPASLLVHCAAMSLKKDPESEWGARSEPGDGGAPKHKEASLGP